MEKILSDIDLSRSVLVATFLELEASVRSGRCPDNASYYHNHTHTYTHTHTHTHAHTRI